MSETCILAKAITYFGQPTIVACDGKCEKAWGINGRPKIDLSSDPDDFAYCADAELGEAPEDPGTYEGGHAKPTTADGRLNKWCCRECERSTFLKDGTLRIPNYRTRRFNKATRNAGGAA